MKSPIELPLGEMGWSDKTSPNKVEDPALLQVEPRQVPVELLVMELAVLRDKDHCISQRLKLAVRHLRVERNGHHLPGLVLLLGELDAQAQILGLPGAHVPNHWRAHREKLGLPERRDDGHDVQSRSEFSEGYILSEKLNVLVF